MKILIIGNGFIGSRCAEMWGSECVVSAKRIETVADARMILDEHTPDAVLNAAGVRGKPNVDWCETHQMETIVGNTVLPLLIAQACQERGIYLLHLGTGCVFYGPSPDPAGWREDDHANPAVVYSKSKYAADVALSALPNVGIARLRMPIDCVPSQANLIDKLVSYGRVIDVENSVTVVEDLVKVLHQLLECRASGIFHTVNRGSITHREILDLYRQYVDSAHTNEWITEDDLTRLGLAKKMRSNNIMQSRNLEARGLSMRDVHDAVREAMEKYAKIKYGH